MGRRLSQMRRAARRRLHERVQRLLLVLLRSLIAEVSGAVRERVSRHVAGRGDEGGRLLAGTMSDPRLDPPLSLRGDAR